MATKKKTGATKKKAAPVKKKPSVESLAKTSDMLSKRNKELEQQVEKIRAEARNTIENFKDGCCKELEGLTIRNSELGVIISGLNEEVSDLIETVDDKNLAIKDMRDYITAYKDRVKDVDLEPVTVPAMANKARVMAAIDELKSIRPELESWLNAITHFINLHI